MRFVAKRIADDGTLAGTLRLKNIFHWNFLRPTIDAYATSFAVFFLYTTVFVPIAVLFAGGGEEGERKGEKRGVPVARSNLLHFQERSQHGIGRV